MYTQKAQNIMIIQFETQLHKQINYSDMGLNRMAIEPVPLPEELPTEY